MVQTNAKENSTVSVTFSADERAMLTRRAHDAGQSIDECIRERVLDGAASEEQVLRFLVEELTMVADESRQALSATKVARSSRNPPIPSLDNSP